jgi:hypothetical protein
MSIDTKEPLAYRPGRPGPPRNFPNKLRTGISGQQARELELLAAVLQIDINDAIRLALKAGTEAILQGGKQ